MKAAFLSAYFPYSIEKQLYDTFTLPNNQFQLHLEFNLNSIDPQ